MNLENITESNDAQAPTMLLFRAGEAYGFRWFGQKLPKNATPIGSVHGKGAIQLMEKETLPVLFEEKILTMFGVKANTLSMDEREFNRSASSLAYEELKLAGSASSPAWSTFVALRLEAEHLSEIYQERTGNITDSPETVFASISAYHPLDLLVWLVNNVQEYTPERYYATCRQFNVGFRTSWVRLVTMKQPPSKHKAALATIKDGAALIVSRRAEK